MTWAITLAIAGAFFLALGSALQERDAVRAPGRSVARLGFLLHLFRRRRWVLGTLAIVAGAVLHLVALSSAPLTIIQPLGVTGLLFAIMLAAMFNRRRVYHGEILAGLAVMAGLVGLLSTFPHEAREPVLSTGTGVGVAGMVAAAGAVGFCSARFLPPGPRALVLASVGGLALGTTSALCRVIAHGVATDPALLFNWLTPVAVGMALFGGLLMQNAYRTGHFAAAYATLLVADPLTGVGIGAFVLSEALPATPTARVVAAGAAALAVVGTIALARAKHRNPDARAARTEHRSHSVPVSVGETP